MADPDPPGLRAVFAGANPAIGHPRYFRDFPRDPGGAPLLPPDLAKRLQSAVGRSLRVEPALQDAWEEAVARELVGLFTGELHAPLHRAASPKHGGGDGPAKRIEKAIVALHSAADALDRIPFMMRTDLARSFLAMLNRDTAQELAQSRLHIPRGRPTNALQQRAVAKLLRLYIIGFLTKPRRTIGNSPFRRFVETVWQIALTDCGMDPHVIGSHSSALYAADRLVRRLTAKRQKDREIA